MSGSYKQLHEIKCGQVTTPDRVKLVDSCVHGYIATANDNAILLFNVERYLKANSACALRKDKPLPDHTPDVRISTTDPISWISFNNEGLVLAVITSSASKGTFVHLLHMKQILQCNTCTLSDISRPVRVCGGEQLTADGNPGWELREFAWNPSVPTLFVAILRSGAVRLLNATPNAKEPEELINQLPSTVDARCLSWSTKGKQLAICLTGSINVQSGPVQGPLILQTDPCLRLKRIVPLNAVFDQFDVGSMLSPLDMLWTSPACFLLGLQSSSQMSGTLMRTVVVHAPTKSTEVNFVEVADLLIKPESSHHQYYLQAIGSEHFVAAQSAGGEQLVVFHSPSGLTTPPTPLVQIELPPAGFVLGLALGFYRPCTSSGDSSKVIAYLVSRLTNGNLAPFVLQMNELVSSIIPTLPKPEELPLPLPSPTSAGAEVPQPVETTPKNVSSTSSSDANYRSTLNKTESESSFMSLSRPNPTRLNTITPISRPQPTPVAEPIQSGHSTSISQPFSVPLTTSTALKPEESDVAQSTLSDKPVALQTSQILPPRDVPLPRSLQIAAAQFTAALQAEAESGRAAWRDLFGLMQNGPQPKTANDNRSTAASQPTGVDVTESKLHDTELFLTALDEVLCELKDSIAVRKEEVSAYAAYAEKVRKALRLCAAGDWMPVLSGHLDPESSRLLGRLKQKARLAESGLFDLDNQIEELFAELKRQHESPLHSSPRSVGDRKPSAKAAGPTSKLMSVVDTITRLLQTERGRVEYVMEGFKRLQLINGTPMKELSQSDYSASSQRLTPRTGQSRTKRNVAATGDESISPVWHSLVQRDRALYQLFAKHQLSTVHAQFVCPLITDESKSSVATINTSADSKPVDSYKVNEGIPPSSVVSETTLNNPQQLKLEKLIDISSKVASMNSPPAMKDLALTDTKVSDSPFSRSPRTTPSSPFVVKAPPIQPTTPSIVETPSETPKPVSCTPSSTASVLASPKTENSATTSNSDSAAFLSPGSFRLGVKTAFGLSPVSSNLVPNSTSVTDAGTVATGSIVTQSSPQSMNPQNPVSSQEARSTEPRAANSPATAALSVGLPTTPSLFASSAGTRSIFAQSFTANPPNTNDSAPQSTVLNTTTTPTTTASTAPTTLPFLTATSTTTGKPFGQSGSSLFGTSSSMQSATPATVTVNPTSSRPAGPGAISLSFGTGGNTNTTTTSSLQSPGLFGNITTTKPSFPHATTTSTMVSTPGQFGFAVSSPTILTPAAPTTIGGAKTTTTGAPGTTPTTSTSMFGLFSAPSNLPAFDLTATSTTSSATLFGAPAMKNTSGGLFVSLKPAAAAASTATTTSTGALFGILSAPTTTTAAPTVTASGNLFRTTVASTQPSTGGLFGSVQTANSTGLFGASTTVTSSLTVVSVTTTSTAPPSTTGGLFGAIPSGLFSSTSTTNVSGSGGLFGTSASTPQSPNLGLFAAQPTGAAPSAPSLFGSANTASPTASGGLFASTTGTKEIQGLFSGSTFGLSSSHSTPQTPVQNVFDKPSGTVGLSPGLFRSPSASPSGAGLFGAPAFGSNTASSTTGTGGLFGSSAPAGGGGLFGSGATMGAGGGLFGNSTTTTTSAGGLFGNSTATKSTASTGGLFSSLGTTSPNAGSGGLFGSSTSSGFGSRPMFDNTKFGASAGPTAFGSGVAAPFGSKPSTGGSLFGALAATAPNPGAGGLFAGLAAKSEGPSFGSLAMHSPTSQPAPATQFGASPSFTQRRA